MNTLSHHFLLTSLTRWLLATAIIVLAFEPVRWLVATWQDPSYSSSGFYFFAVCAALFCWSAGSKRYTSKPVQHRYALALLGGTALIRLAGQVFAINVIGALALIIDVYAIAYLSALHLRKRAIAPFWLAACFAFSLPLERIIQRSIGYGLQHLSADTSCVILGSFFDSVSCHGVRILLAGQDVLVDLPCSGARALVLLLFLFCVTAAICRTSLKGNLFGMALVLASSLLTNALRITFLAVGIAFPQDGIDVMAQPWHDIIGLTALAQGCIPIYFWGRWNYCRPKAQHSRLDQLRWLRPRFMRHGNYHYASSQQSAFIPLLASLGFLLLALGIHHQPGKAFDVSKKNLEVSLPAFLLDNMAEPEALTPIEQAYFTQYGGAAQKARYGENNLMIIYTSSPLRHLHAPDECMRGLGFDVAYLGMSYAPLPTAIYKATRPNGEAFRVAVSFVADDGYITTNVSEAVWRWINHSQSTWRAIQRISPWEQSPQQIARFDRAILIAFDLQTPEPQFASIQGEKP